MPELAQNEVPVLNQSGQLVAVSKSSLPSLLRQGYRVPGSEEIKEGQLEEKYGIGTANELKTFGENVLGGATFNLSKIAEQALGVTTPEAMAAREKFNPWAAGLGQGTGILASSFLLPGGGAVGAVSRGTTEAGAQLLGRTAANLAEAGIAKQIAARTVGGALEGAIYGGLGQSMNEAALGDPTLNAQKVFHNAGIGALFGGAIGGGVTALGAGLRKGGDWLVGRYGREAGLPPEVTAEVKPQGEFKAQGTVDFGMPDEKILQRAEGLNPRNPLKKNDLDAIRQFGEPDATGKPTVFSKIGTAELPTLDPGAQGQVYLGDVVKEGMKNVGLENARLDATAENILKDSNLTLSRESYQKMFSDEISAIKKSDKFGDPIGKRAVKVLEDWKESAENLPDTLNASQIRSRLQALREEGKLYVKGGGLKEDFVSESLNKVQKNVDDYLKDNIGDYKKLMKEYAPFVRKSQELEDHLGWNFQRNDSDLVSDWVTNRVAKPFQSNLPGTKSDAELMKWFSPYTGVDLEKTAKMNFIFGKLNPESAQAGQLGTFGGRLLEAAEHPTQIPGQLLKGAAKIAITGELPDFLVQARQREVQNLLLGKSSGLGAADRIANSISGLISKSSDLLKPTSQLHQLLVPEGVAAMNFILNHEDMPDAEQKLETLVAYERARNSADKEIESGIKGIFKVSNEPMEENKKLSKFVNESPEKQGKSIEGIVSDLNTLVNNPSVMVERLGKNIEGLEKHAPNLAQGLNMTATRAVQFLSQRLQLPDRKPLDGKFVPSKNQVIKASKYLRTIQNPYSVLEDLKRGNFSQESKDVLTNVMPELYDHLKQKVIQAVADKKDMIPQSKRFSLSYFLDQDLDSQLTPQAILKNMGVFQKSKTQPTPRGASAKHLTTPTRFLTPTQVISTR